MPKTTVLMDTKLVENLQLGWKYLTRRSQVLHAVENFGRGRTNEWTDKEWEEEIGFVPDEDDFNFDWSDIEDGRQDLLELAMHLIETGITNWTMGEDA